jgi:glycosyltransferase involved in cell wall biosynthesis
MMPATPLTGPAPVSVIVPTFNRARFLKDSLPSLLGQNLRPAEVIVADDGSTDDTAAVVGGFGSVVRYLRQENAGKAAAINAALPRTRHPNVWIFDDDDVAEPDALSDLHRALTAHPECGFAWGRSRRFQADRRGRRTVLPMLPIPAVAPEDFHHAILSRCFVFQPGLLVRRSCYEAVGPFDVSFVRSQDYEMLVRLSRVFTGTATGTTVFSQRIHAGTRGTAAQSFAAARAESFWRSFDQRIFRSVYETHDLAEYLPRGRAATLTGDEIELALFRRLAVMGRKGLWDLAAADLRTLGSRLDRTSLRPPEAAALRDVLDGWSYGRESLLAEEGAPFRDALAAIPDPDLSAAIRRALIWPLPFVLRQGLASGTLDRARVASELLRRLARPPDLAGILWTKTLGRFGAGRFGAAR